MAMVFNNELALENKYCSLDSLTNESSVEQFFIIRLLTDLGYNDAEIKTKQSITKLTLGKGRKKEHYKPDYVCFAGNKPRIVIDAKSIDENIDNYIYQASSYSLFLNNKYEGIKPVKYFMLSNGKTTKLFNWDEERPIMDLSFSDFKDANINFKKLQDLISRNSIINMNETTEINPDNFFKLNKPDPKELNGIFTACHNLIWKKEKINPTDAFYKFTKLMFIKLNQDKSLKDRTFENTIVEKSSVTFSTHWIKEMEQYEVNNPFDTILFRRLMERLETEITEKRKKRIFEKNEKLDLKPSTIKDVVKILEHYNLFSIDEDLNGRLFETFLNATIRGKDLGQYFTPRSVVKFMVNMANLQINENHIDKCFDACCGTGGFLIESMANMDQKISSLPIGNLKKKMLRNDLITKCLYGIDANKIVTRIARINMYLHGDGGSRIYNIDALDKQMEIEDGLDVELESDNNELKNTINKNKFDVILTNPPFAMKYEKKKSDELKILKQYKLAHKDATSEKLYSSLRSSVMFMERYYDLLKDGGKLLTVIDESVLNTSTNKNVRNFIKEHFMIKAVISLPKSTFVKADSAVKTSILYLIKKSPTDDIQPKIFMAISNNVGHTTTGRVDQNSNDLDLILDKFQKFELGNKID